MIRGVTKPIDKELNVSIHNRFDIEVIDSRTGEVRQRAQAFNVICDYFWTYRKENPRYAACYYISYGGGSGTPLPSDTKLFSYISHVSTGVYNSGLDRSKGIAFITRKGTLSETAAVGKTITEVGFHPYVYSSQITTHAMLQDMNGNPLSITKTATDIINIYATIYAHWKPEGYNGAYFLGALSKNSLLYHFLGQEFDPSSTANMYLKGGPAAVATQYSSWTMDLDAKTLTWTLSRLGASSGNEGGFGWIGYGRQDDEGSMLDPSFLVNVQGSYPVTGETVGTGDGTTTEFSTDFDLPQDATVYVNGVAVTSGVTVKREPLSLTPHKYLIQIAGINEDGSIIPTQKDMNLYHNSTYYFYNPLHEIGLYSYNNANIYWSCTAALAFSDDMVNWSPTYTKDELTIPAQYRNCKYIRATMVPSVGDKDIGTSELGYFTKFSFPPEVTGKNIVFDEAPAVGSVITIDYTTPMVPKDSNHVYDFTLVFHYGEYSEGQG